MKLYQGMSGYRLPFWKRVLILLLVIGPGLLMAQTKENTPNTRIWDTMSPLTKSNDFGNRNHWRLVPTDLLNLEANPLAVSADPGYYGREYAFQGDAVVENRHYTAVFHSIKGRVVIYSKGHTNDKLLEFAPLELKNKSARLTHCRIVQNTGDEAALEVTFSAGRAKGSLSAVIAFGPSEIIEIKSTKNIRGISLLSPIAYGIVPCFISDDLIFSPAEYPSMNSLCVPSENLFVGLLEGGSNMLVVTWPKGDQQTKLVLGDEQRKPRLIESVDLTNDIKSLYLAILSAPGIWHKEELTAPFLEKDVAIDWKRPFPVKWMTQLSEAGVKTTYKFRESRLQRIWRGVIGSYTYPVWFSDGKTFYRTSKKIPPKGESVIYFLERQNTPPSVSTPVDIMKATLGRQICDSIIDLPGRTLRTHHRRGDAGVRRACTCGCTEAIQAVFDAGQEVQRKEYVIEAVDDMVYFVTRHMERIGEYQDFARDMLKFLNQTKKNNPGLKPFLDSMDSITQEITEVYSRSKENIKTLTYMDALTKQTKALTRMKDPKNLPTYEDLSKKWRAMGGAQDDLVAQCHRITRKLYQEAGYRCVDQPKAVEIAEQIRTRCRQCLRNPDGYEIWPDY